MYGKTYTTVELICENNEMDAIIDRFGKSVEVCITDETHFKATGEVSVNHLFFSWIFGFGGKVVINGPDEVKQKYREMVLKAAEDL